MAKLVSQFAYLGSLDNVSAYRMRGVDYIILRKKGGASKEKIKNSPVFKRTRENNKEFGGRATAAKWISHALSPHKVLGDYNIAGPLNALLQPAQALDTNVRGKRHILLSKSPLLLQGFSFNRKTLFDSVIRSATSWSLSRESFSGRIDIPRLLPGINFFAPEKYPMFCVTAVLGIVPDLFYTPHRYKPSSKAYRENDRVEADSGWYPVMKGAPAFTLELKHGFRPPDQSFSLALSIGICFGTMRDTNSVKQIKYAGAAKVIGVV
jgi:hypothetical protein